MDVARPSLHHRQSRPRSVENYGQKLVEVLLKSAESPWWLVRSGRLDEAKVAVKRLSSNNVNHDVDAGRTVAMMVCAAYYSLYDVC